MDPRLSTRHGFTHIKTHTLHALEMLRVKHQDDASQPRQTLQKSGTLLHQHPLHLSLLLLIISVLFLRSPSFSLSLFALPLLPHTSLFLIPPLPPSLPGHVFPSLLCWCCISRRDRLKQMLRWETGCMRGSERVHVLPPQIDSSATCAQWQLPTDGGGIRDGWGWGGGGCGKKVERKGEARQ